MIITELPDAAGPPRNYRLEIPKIGKPWLTANQRLHPMARARHTRNWRDITGWRARGMPTLDRAYIIAELRFVGRRRRDPANWAPTAKACVDGLVDAGVFIDDDATRVTGPDCRLGPLVMTGQEAVVLHLWPLEVS